MGSQPPRPVQTLDTTPTELLRCSSPAVCLLSRSLDAIVLSTVLEVQFMETFEFLTLPSAFMCQWHK